MLVNDELIVEIVTPGTDEPAAPGKVGEVVVTRLQGDYPLLRFATGDLSAWASPGRLKRLDGARRSVGQGQGPVRPSRPDRRDRQAPPRARPAAPYRAPRRRAGRDDASRRDRDPERGAQERGRRDAPGADHAARRGRAGRARLAPERRQDHRRRKARAGIVKPAAASTASNSPGAPGRAPPRALSMGAEGPVSKGGALWKRSAGISRSWSASR